MQAFQNNPSLKADLISGFAKQSENGSLTAHPKPGQSAHIFNRCLVESLGTALGHAIELEDVHYLLDVPAPLVTLLNHYFHELPSSDRLSWPGQVLSAMQVGADYRSVHVDLLIALEADKPAPDQAMLNDLMAWRAELWALPGDSFDLRQNYTTRSIGPLFKHSLAAALYALNQLGWGEADSSLVKPEPDPFVERENVQLADMLLTLLQTPLGKDRPTP